jgi:hypothetical protein
MPTFDWSDSFWVALPPHSTRDPVHWQRRMFGTPRRPKRFDLMSYRNRAVRVLGLKSTAAGGGQMRFATMASSPDEVVVGMDDVHLDFRVGISVRDDPAPDLSARLVITTIVRRHNLLGRAYFAVVAGAHHVLVPRWTERNVHDDHPPTTSRIIEKRRHESHI